jgi:hypothetical protein
MRQPVNASKEHVLCEVRTENLGVARRISGFGQLKYWHKIATPVQTDRKFRNFSEMRDDAERSADFAAVRRSGTHSCIDINCR